MTTFNVSPLACFCHDRNLQITLDSPKYLIRFISSFIGGSCRVTLVAAFGFLPPNFRRWWGPMNGTLSFCECRLNDGDTQIQPVVIKFV